MFLRGAAGAAGMGAGTAGAGARAAGVDAGAAGVGAGAAGVGAGAGAAAGRVAAAAPARTTSAQATALTMGRAPAFDACRAVMTAAYSHTTRAERQRSRSARGPGRLARLLQADRLDRARELGEAGGVLLQGVSGAFPDLDRLRARLLQGRARVVGSDLGRQLQVAHRLLHLVARRNDRAAFEKLRPHRQGEGGSAQRPRLDEPVHRAPHLGDAR